MKSLSSEDKTAYLIKPILKVLQKAGSQLERSEIKERITDSDNQIAEYVDMIKAPVTLTDGKACSSWQGDCYLPCLKLPEERTAHIDRLCAATNSFAHSL